MAKAIRFDSEFPQIYPSIRFDSLLQESPRWNA